MCYSVSKSCPTCCDPMDCSTPGFPVPHHLPDFAQVHVHCIGDAIHAIMLGDSMPLIFSSPSALNLSQHHSLFQCVSCWHQLVKLLKLSVDSSKGAVLLHRKSQTRIRSSMNDLAPGTNWGAVMGEGVATFLAAPNVPGRRALCS